MKTLISIYIFFLSYCGIQTALGNVVNERAQNNTIIVIDSLKTTKTSIYIKQLKSFVWNANLYVGITGKNQSLPEKKSNTLIIAIGPKAFQETLGYKQDFPIIAVYTTRKQYDEIKDKIRGKKSKTTALFADADLNDQIALITGIYSKTIKIGVLLGESNLHYQYELETLAEEYKISIFVEEIMNEKGIYKSLNALEAKGVDTILAIPDKDVFNKRTLRGLILSSYRTVINFRPNK